MSGAVRDDLAKLRLELLGYDLVRAVHAMRDRADTGCRRDPTWESPRFTELVAKIDFARKDQVAELLREAGRAVLDEVVEHPAIADSLPPTLATAEAKYLPSTTLANSDATAQITPSERGTPTAS